jgi:hypothetical protein
MNDQAILERVLARRSEKQVPQAVTNIREALGIGDDGYPLVRDDAAMRNTLSDYGPPAPPTQVTKLPEVHDPAGDSYRFHIPAGRASQVLGSNPIDESRIPDQLNPLVTDKTGRALPMDSALAREREAQEVMKSNEALTKLMRKWGAKRISYSFSR